MTKLLNTSFNYSIIPVGLFTGITNGLWLVQRTRFFKEEDDDSKSHH